MTSPCHPAVPLKVCTPKNGKSTFTVEFTAAKKYTCPRWLDEETNCGWTIPREYFLAIKSRDFLTPATMWWNVKDRMLSEMSQSHKDLHWRLQRRGAWGSPSHTEGRGQVVRAKGGRRWREVCDEQGQGFSSAGWKASGLGWFHMVSSWTVHLAVVKMTNLRFYAITFFFLECELPPGIQKSETVSPHAVTLSADGRMRNN